MKLCSKCRQRKPEYAFNSKQAANDGFRPECRECQKQENRRYITEVGRDEIARRARVAHKVRKFKLTMADYIALLKQQNGCCAICRDELDLEGQGTHVDHDHKTGEVRGILCRGCNGGLGLFRDDPARLRAAAEFLERAAAPTLRVVK